MRRLKILGRAAVYHCVSRAVNREKLFDTRAREMLRRMIWQVAEFSGVEVLSYCVMSNHFHVLVRVPDADAVHVDDAELVRRYRLLYRRPGRYRTMAIEVLEKVLAEGRNVATLGNEMVEALHLKEARRILSLVETNSELSDT